MPELPEREKEKRTYVVEAGKIYETPAEKEGLVKRVWDFELEKPIAQKGQILVTSSYAQKPKVVLPVTRSTYFNPANWHKPITFAITWLLRWVERIIKKMKPQEVAFREA